MRGQAKSDPKDRPRSVSRGLMYIRENPGLLWLKPLHPDSLYTLLTVIETKVISECSHESVSFAVPQREKHYVQLSISKSKAQSNQIGEEGENTLKKNGAEQNREHYPPPL